MIVLFLHSYRISKLDKSKMMTVGGIHDSDIKFYKFGERIKYVLSV